MPMNLGDASATNALLHWLIGTPRETLGPVTAAEARIAAETLAASAYKRLDTGFNSGDVRQSWGGEPGSPLQATGRIALLEDAVLAAWELLTDTVPASPPGLADWYHQNLAETAEEIRDRKGGRVSQVRQGVIEHLATLLGDDEELAAWMCGRGLRHDAAPAEVLAALHTELTSQEPGRD